MALAAYRHILRAAKTAFEGDTPTLTAALHEVRRAFKTHRDLPQHTAHTQKLIHDAEDIATVLRQNVVQGRLNDDGRYKLRIHDQIERGDNESVKVTRGTQGKRGGGCCSG